MADKTEGTIVVDPKVIRIGNVELEPVNPADETLERRLYMAAEIDGAGMRPYKEYEAIEDLDARGTHILVDLYRSKHAFTFLAGLYTRRGEEWSLERAAENAELFRTAKGDALAMSLLAISALLMGVFMSGSSSTTSLTTSSLALDAAQQPAPNHSGARQAATTDRPGTRSSARSRAPTTRETRGSSGGVSASSSSRTSGSSGKKRAPPGATK